MGLTATEKAVDLVEEDRVGIRLLLIYFYLRHTGYIRYSRGLLWFGAGAQQQAKKALLPPKGGNMNIYGGNLSREVTGKELQREFMVSSFS